MKMYYTGIGSRQTPQEILDLMTTLSKVLDNKDFILRSGGADGADIAFEKGSYHKEIYLPWKDFNKNISNYNQVSDEAMRIASSYHPYWQKLTDPVKKLMGRNVYQVLGKSLDSPSEFVICWTPDGAEKKTTNNTGGTGQAIRIANDYSVPVYNLKNEENRKKLKTYLTNLLFYNKICYF